MESPFPTKNALRTSPRRLNRLLPAAEKAAAAGRIAAQIEALPAFARARCIACFCALSDEPPTAAWLGRWRTTHRLVVPHVEGERMCFCDYRPEVPAVGAFGLAEPLDPASPCPAEEIDLMIVPGVAFTLRGDRLGRGKGFYDRYLALPRFRAACIGVCFAHQIVDRIAAEPHDRPMTQVIFG